MLPLLQRFCGLQTPGKPNWIRTFVLTVFVVLIGFGSVSCSTCTRSDLLSLQRPCQKENDNLITHTGTNETHKLCNSLKDLWFCTAKNVPGCFHNMTVIYEHLTHSPHNCELGHDEFLKIQKIIRDNEVKEATEASSSATTTPRLQSTKESKGDEGDEGYVVTGDTSGHAGNTASSFRNCDHVTHLLLILLTLLPTFPTIFPVL